MGELPGREPFEQQVFAAWTKDESLRRSSSSGGLFSELAKSILNSQGVVFGAAFTEGLELAHIHIENEADLHLLQGSKYVQSSMDFSFVKALEFLRQGRKVLFSGTPCQISGLRKFLGPDFENLFTIDVVCHGVPSPMVFERYKRWLEEKNHSRLRSFSFRDKHWSWGNFNTLAKFDDSKTVYRGKLHDDPWMRGFLRDYFLRPCCHVCRYTTLQRQGDISLADYWNYPKSLNPKYYNNDKGISLVLVNSPAGAKLFDEVVGAIIFRETDIVPALKGNSSLRRPPRSSLLRENFWRDYNSGMDFDILVQKYMYPHPTPWQLRMYYRGFIPHWAYRWLTAARIFASKTAKKLLGR